MFHSERARSLIAFGELAVEVLWQNALPHSPGFWLFAFRLRQYQLLSFLTCLLSFYRKSEIVSHGHGTHLPSRHNFDGGSELRRVHTRGSPSCILTSYLLVLARDHAPWPPPCLFPYPVVYLNRKSEKKNPNQRTKLAKRTRGNPRTHPRLQTALLAVAARADGP